MGKEAIVKRKEQLPVKLEDLIQFTIISNEAIKAQKAKIRALKKTGAAQNVIKAAILDGINAAELLFEALARLGEILGEKPLRTPIIDSSLKKTIGGSKSDLPPGIKKKQSFQTKQFHKRRPIWKAIIDKAKTKLTSIPSENKALKTFRKMAIEEKRAKQAKPLIILGERPFEIWPEDFQTTKKIKDNTVDFVITDPPYIKDAIKLYEPLGIFAERILKPGGSLIVMTGQTYLPEYINDLMKSGLNYYWTCAFMMPGPNPNLWQKEVGTKWKPLLWFVKSKYTGKFVSDVIHSPKLEKGEHDWQQPVKAFVDIISRFAFPGNLIVDPFMGTGTTGIAALECGCNFKGIEINADTCNIAKRRLEEKWQKMNTEIQKK